MNTVKSTGGLPAASLFTAVAASLCCITPVLAFIGGASGAASSFSWIAPYRPYLIGITIAVLTVAWYAKLKPQKTTEDCGCPEKKTSFWQGKSFLLIVTVLAGVLMAFPAYAHIFYPNHEKQAAAAAKTNTIQKATLHIRGMGCADCEQPINNELAAVKGVLQYKTSYALAISNVTFDTTKTNIAAIVNAVNKTGYTVTNYSIAAGNAPNSDSAQVSFYEVPLVCNAAPTIGCGSRSKPALLELEKNPAVKEAWLNRAGTVIAIVWKESDRTTIVAKPIFQENNISFTEVDEMDAAPYRVNFRAENLWYRGGNVDMLSREEAATIAGSAVKFALEKNLITRDEAAKIKADVEAYFKEELVKIRTNDQLNEDSQNKFREALYAIAEKYIGKQRAEKAMALYQENAAKQCKKDGTCTTPGAKKDCCNKN